MENNDRLYQSAVLGEIEHERHCFIDKRFPRRLDNGDYLMLPQGALLARRAYYQMPSIGLESYLKTIEEIETLCQENL